MEDSEDLEFNKEEFPGGAKPKKDVKNYICTDDNTLDKEHLLSSHDTHPSLESPKVLKSKGKKKKEKRIIEKSDITTTKKPSMKTASDVISRLLWDDLLPQEHFTIGYLDRFLGVIEKPFTVFDWSNLASVDNYTLAIPKHRIQYFKYKHHKVWDKNDRLDIVFGSTGSTSSITDFMRKVDNEETELQTKLLCEDMFEDCCIKDDSPDVLNKKPNYFIGVKLTDEVTQNIKVVVDEISDKDEFFKQCCVPQELLHLTLSMLRLNSVAEVNDVLTLLKKMKNSLLEQSLSFQLEGLRNIEHRVVYVQVIANSTLQVFLKEIENTLREGEINILSQNRIQHVTVAKVSRTVAHQWHSKYIDPALYEPYSATYFGSQMINNIVLCPIGEGIGEDGFYICAGKITL